VLTTLDVSSEEGFCRNVVDSSALKAMASLLQDLPSLNRLGLEYLELTDDHL
jgi:hypothetical protein